MPLVTRLDDATLVLRESLERRLHPRQLAGADLLRPLAQLRDRRHDVERATATPRSAPPRPARSTPRVPPPRGGRRGSPPRPTGGRRCRTGSSPRARGSQDRGRAAPRCRSAAAAGPCAALWLPRPARRRARSPAPTWTRRRRPRRAAPRPSRSSGSASAPKRRARAALRSSPRLTTATMRPPRFARFRAVSSPVSPAPTTTTARPVRSPKTCCASAAAADATDVGALGDRRLGTHLLARVQRLAEQPVEHGPRRAGLVGRAHLAEDLALAGHHRVEPGSDAERVQRRRLVAQAVEHGTDVGACQAPQRGLGARPAPRRRRRPRGTARCGCRSRGRPPRRPRRQPRGELRRRVDVERDALTHLDGREHGARFRRGRGSCEVARLQAELHGDDEREAGEDGYATRRPRQPKP